LRSGVSKPSVKTEQTGASSPRASTMSPRIASIRARLVDAQHPYPGSHLLLARDGLAKVGLGWFGLIKLEKQFPAQGQNLRPEDDFLRVHLKSVLGCADGFSDSAVERLGFRQQSEESSQPQSSTNPPYTRQARSDCATPSRVPPRFARAQPVMMWARFEAELAAPGLCRPRRTWRSPQTRDLFADAASAALPIRHTTPPTIANGAPKLEVKIVAPAAADECDSPSAIHANGTWQNLVFRFCAISRRDTLMPSNSAVVRIGSVM